MNKKDKIKLDVMSNIDDEIVDHVTKKRFKLARFLEKRPIYKQKKWIVSAVAAVLLLSIGIFLAVQLFGKQVPIYRGMTVSSASPSVSTASVDDLALHTVLMAGEGHFLSYQHHGHHVDQEDPFDRGEGGHGDIEEAIKDSLSVQGSAAEMYYANPNEDIYITIHVDNPDNFEILSFTLNGNKYSSYMFEDGSDMENLILKVNVGDATGVVEYTIDAIKYVDGTVIKDVRMEGDRTVRVGVYTEHQPVASVVDELIGFDRLSFEVTVSDVERLIALSEGKVQVVLYDGEELIATQDVALGEKTTVLFEGLKTNTLYQYAIVATYDALDGTGYGNYVLSKKAFYTQEILAFDAVEIAHTSISFRLLWNEAFADKTMTSFVLLQGEEKVQDVSPDATGIDGLYSDTDYKLVATYVNHEKTETVVLEFRTKAKVVPTPQLTLSDNTQTGFSFEWIENDPDNVGDISKIELLHGDDTPIVAESLDVRAFDGLLSGNGYTVRVTYVYDLGNGLGAQTIVKTLDVTTVAKAVPVISLTNLNVTEYTIAFGVTMTDPDVIGELLRMELSLGGNVLATETQFDALSYEDLIPNEAYTVTVYYAYDLSDGAGRIEANYTQTVKTVSVVTINGITYQLYDDKTATVIGADESITEPIFTCLDGYTITAIGERAFENHSKLAHVTLPSTVKKIGKEAFAWCQKLKTVTMEGGVERICEHAFLQCTKLKTITLPSTLKVIERSAFYYCESLESITFPDGLTTIGEYAFDVCWSLEEVVIPASVTTVGWGTFGCKVYTEHDQRPDGWQTGWHSQGENAYVVWGLKEFYTDTQGVTYALLNNNTAIVIAFDDSTAEVVIGVEGYTVTEIGTYTFAESKKLTSVVLPEGLITIWDHAFAGCQTLEAISLPSTLTKIGSDAFGDCGALKEVVIPDTVLEIGPYAFKCRTYVAHAEKPEDWPDEWYGDSFAPIWNFKEFHVDAQGVRYALLNDGTAIVIGYTEDVASTLVLELEDYVVTRIVSWAFESCDAAQIIIIPETMALVEAWAFQLGNAKIYVEAAEQPDGWNEDWNNYGRPVIWNFKEFYTDAQGVTYALLNDNTAIVIGFDDSTAEVVIGVEGYTVTEIQEAVFAYSKNLTRIVIPEGVRTMGNHALRNCSKLTYVSLPSTLTAIGESAFSDCTKLTSIHIPSGVLSIGSGAFWGCSNLKEVTLSEGLQKICSGVFTNCTSLPYVIIPASVTEIEPEAFPIAWGLQIYARAPQEPQGWMANWISDTTNVIWNFKEFYTDTQGVTYALLNDGTAVVIGYTEDVSSTLVLELEDYVVTRIVSRAFDNGDTVKTIVIPETVIMIESYALQLVNAAFYAEAAELPEEWSENWNNCNRPVIWNFKEFYTDAQGVTYVLCNDGTAIVIGFDDSTAEVVIGVEGYTVTEIGANAFENSKNMTSIVLTEGLKIIGHDAFAGCKKLQTVKLPSTLTVIERNAFGCCEKLSSIILPNGLTTIGDEAFNDVWTLSQIIIPASVTSIGNSVFECLVYAMNAEQPAGWHEDWHCKGDEASIIWNFKEFYTDAQGVKYALLNDGTAVVIGYTEDVASTLVLELEDYVVTRIVSWAFDNGDTVKTIVIPETVIMIESYALQLVNAGFYAEAAELPEEWSENWNNCNRPVIWNFKEFYTDAQGVTYALCNNGTAVVIGFDDSTAEVVIGVEGYTVTEIVGRTFEESKNLIRIVLPEGLKIIGERAFANCSKLTSVNLPSTLTELGTGAFTACSKLTGITVPAGVKVIPNDAFSWCNDLRDVVFSEGLETICEYAFLECRNISVLVIPQSVTKIEAHAFSGTYGTKICAKAESEPSGWQAHWDYDVMLAVWNIKEIYVDDQGITYALCNDGTAAVVTCTNSTTTDTTLFVDGYAINRICNRALENRGNVTSIVIPKTVTVIEAGAFQYCWDLTEIRFDGTVAEWNAIEKENEWNSGMNENCIVHCTDGTVGI